MRHFLNNFPFGIQLIIITLNSLAAIRFHFLAVGLLTHETILLASLKSGLRSPLLSRTWRYTVPVFSSLGIVGTGGLSFIGTGDCHGTGANGGSCGTTLLATNGATCGWGVGGLAGGILAGWASAAWSSGSSPCNMRGMSAGGWLSRWARFVKSPLRVGWHRFPT